MSAFGDETALAQKWVVESEYSGMRADHYLVKKIGRLSRSKAKRIILAGDLRCEGSQVKPSRRLRHEECIELWRLPPEEEPLDLDSVKVVYEDANWLVVDKPAGLAVHPTARYLHNTLTGWLKKYAPQIPIHPCHRLDRETSGVLVCAKNRSAEATLKTAFQNGAVRKRYLAIVRGNVTSSQLVDAPLSLAGDSGLVKIRMTVGDRNGLPSRTRVAPNFYDPAVDRTLVSCEPLTGRQHQIRAHLAYIGHPIVGDKIYAMGDAFFDAFTRRKRGDLVSELEHPRHALHAYSIAFESENRQLCFHAALPADLQSLISHCAMSYPPRDPDHHYERSHRHGFQGHETPQVF